MSAWPGRLQPSTDLGVATGLAVTRGVVLPRRVLIALALAALALGVVLSGVMLDRDLGGTSRAAPSAVHAHSYSRAGLLSLPLAAQGPVSAVLGANSRAYRVTPTREGLRAASPAQQLKLSFTRTGVSIASGQARLALGLRAVGYGASLRSLGAVMPRLEGDRVAYSHPAASAWYANGPLGLEQGFTVPRAPAGHAAGALTLAIALRGNLHASLTDHGRAVTLSRAGHPVLRYSDLLATDANGHTLRSWLMLDAGRLLIRVAARGASYPLRVDPLVQNTKLTGGEESGDARFGASVALSSDGNTALVGGGLDNEAAGAAWVFTNSGGTWTQQGPKLVGDCTSSCGGPSGTEESGEGEFGTSVALSSDGNTALVGGGTDDSGIGSAWVFTRSGSTWSQEGSKLTPAGDTVRSAFGSSVALSSEGNTALIGAPIEGPSSATGVGSAWVFTLTAGTWSQQGPKLTASDEVPSADFGASVALSSDGNTALIGGPFDNDEAGAVWVFARSLSTWSQQGSKLTPNDAENLGNGDDFGSSVALSADGETALIGAPRDGESLSPSHVGAAWVFTGSGSHWTQQGPKLTNSPSSVSEFGRSVALSSEGTIALIGGEQEEDTHGAAWVFTPSGSTWTQQGSKLTPNDASGAASAFGDSVALSGNGDTALIGGFYDNLQAGAAWIFDAPGTGGGEASGGTGTDTGTAGSSGGGGTSTGTGTSAGTGSSTGAGNASTGKGSSGSAAASLAKQLGLPSSKGCVSQRKLAIHVAEHIAQAGGSAKIKSAEVLLNGHVVAKLKGSDLIAHVSLAGLAKGSFKVTVKATTTAGKTLSASSTFHTCAHAKGHK
jgi:FG-GAP repeat